MGVFIAGRFALTLLPDTSYRFNWDVARRILKIGVPSGLQGILRNGSGLVYFKLIAMSALSTTAVAAYTIGNQVEHILRRTGLSYGTVATAMVGQHLGAKDPAGAERHGWTILFISVVTNIALSLPAVVFAGSFMSIFTDAPRGDQYGCYLPFMRWLLPNHFCVLPIRVAAASEVPAIRCRQCIIL